MSVRATRSTLGRFLIIRDRDGVRHAIVPGAISVLRETEDGETLLLLTGGRMIAMAAGLEGVIAQLE